MKPRTAAAAMLLTCMKAWGMIETETTASTAPEAGAWAAPYASTRLPASTRRP
jgi:hypothetical protein